MKVSEAIEILKESDPDAELMLSSDQEGNSYRKAMIGEVETFCLQDREYVSCHPDDIASGEYEGWEEHFFKAVVVW